MGFKFFVLNLRYLKKVIVFGDFPEKRNLIEVKCCEDAFTLG